MSVLLVANPSARSGAAAPCIPRAVVAFQRAGHHVMLHMTTASSLRLEAELSVAERVVVLGGDGTFAAVATAMLDAALTPPLGLLPAGIANNHGRSYGIPTVYDDLERAVSIALGEARCASDVGWITAGSRRTRFYDTVGWGFQAAVLHTRTRYTSRLGELGYALALLATLPARPHRFDASLRIDGHQTHHTGITDVLVSNSLWYGGRWILDRGARPDDGRLELITSDGWGDLLRHAWGDLGHRTPSGRRRSSQGSHFTLAFSRPLPSQIDGEPGPTGSTFEIEVEPGALSVLVPR